MRNLLTHLSMTGVGSAGSRTALAREVSFTSAASDELDLLELCPDVLELTLSNISSRFTLFRLGFASCETPLSAPEVVPSAALLSCPEFSLLLLPANRMSKLLASEDRWERLSFSEESVPEGAGQERGLGSEVTSLRSRLCAWDSWPRSLRWTIRGFTVFFASQTISKPAGIIATLLPLIRLPSARTDDLELETLGAGSGFETGSELEVMRLKYPVKFFLRGSIGVGAGVSFAAMSPLCRDKLESESLVQLNNCGIKAKTSVRTIEPKRCLRETKTILTQQFKKSR